MTIITLFIILDNNNRQCDNRQVSSSVISCDSRFLSRLPSSSPSQLSSIWFPLQCKCVCVCVCVCEYQLDNYRTDRPVVYIKELLTTVLDTHNTFTNFTGINQTSCYWKISHQKFQKVLMSLFFKVVLRTNSTTKMRHTRIFFVCLDIYLQASFWGALICTPTSRLCCKWTLWAQSNFNYILYKAE